VKFYFCHRIFFLSVSPGGAGLVHSSILVRFASLRVFGPPSICTGPVCPCPFPALKPRFSRFDLLVRFPKAEDLSVRAALQDLSIFPKAEDLSIRAARQDLSVFPKAEDLSDFQVWDIGQVPVSNFDWIPFTPLWSPSPVLHPMYLIPSLPPAHLR
jgi:hypothetical protein